MQWNRKVIGIVIGFVVVFLLAVAFRFYDLQNYPPGLFPDQAANGEDALLILQGDARPFYPRGNGREALFFYLQAAAIKTFGIGVWPMFSASALMGVLTVIATFFATRVWFGRLAGLLAAVLLATSAWHVTLSRTGFRAIMIPLFVAAFTAFVGYTIKAVRQQKVPASYIYAALAGAAFMGGFYTYIAYRIMVAVVGGMVCILLLAALHPRIGFPHFRRYRWQLAVAVLSGLLVFAPLGWYFWQHPADFIGRAGQVSVFSPALQQEFGGGKLLPTIVYVTRETLRSFFIGEGDLNWRHSVAGYPLLNPLVGFLFLLGLAWTVRGAGLVALKVWRGEEVHVSMIYPYMLLLLVGMLAPVLSTAEGIPHGLRSIGLIVPIFILAGTAGSVVLYWVKQRIKHIYGEAVALGVLVGLLGLAGLYDGALYFFIARNDAAAHYAYRADLTEVSKYINAYHAQHPDAPRPYLALDAFSVQTVHYLTSVAAHDHVVGEAVHPDEDKHLWRQVDPAASSTVELAADEIIIFTQSTLPDADKYQQTYPNVTVLDTRYNRFGQEIMRVYAVPPAAPSEPGALDA